MPQVRLLPLLLPPDSLLSSSRLSCSAAGHERDGACLRRGLRWTQGPPEPLPSGHVAPPRQDRVQPGENSRRSPGAALLPSLRLLLLSPPCELSCWRLWRRRTQPEANRSPEVYRNFWCRRCCCFPTCRTVQLTRFFFFFLLTTPIKRQSRSQRADQTLSPRSDEFPSLTW